MDTPVVLVDVDGVISLFGFDRDREPDGRFVIVDGIPHFLSAAAGGLLRGLLSEFELIWCSGWEEKANDYLPHALGLPGPLPFLTFERPTGHWKLPAIDAYAGPSRPLAWIDDDLDERCYQWAAARAAPTLLVPTDPAVGLTANHVATLRAWAARNASPS
jgi:hypothetical protein